VKTPHLTSIVLLFLALTTLAVQDPALAQNCDSGANWRLVTVNRFCPGCGFPEYVQVHACQFGTQKCLAAAGWVSCGDPFNNCYVGTASSCQFSAVETASNRSVSLLPSIVKTPCGSGDISSLEKWIASHPSVKGDKRLLADSRLSR
jgi:hypothetical protein